MFEFINTKQTDWLPEFGIFSVDASELGIGPAEDWPHTILLESEKTGRVQVFRGPTGCWDDQDLVCADYFATVKGRQLVVRIYND